MKIEDVRTIAVLGAGTMGHGIAQVCAGKGFQVSLQDIKEDFIQSGLVRIEKFLQGSIERGKISKQEADTMLARIKVTTNLKEAVRNADLIIEAIPENIALKKDLFKELTVISKEAAT